MFLKKFHYKEKTHSATTFFIRYKKCSLYFCWKKTTLRIDTISAKNVPYIFASKKKHVPHFHYVTKNVPST